MKKYTPTNWINWKEKINNLNKPITRKEVESVIRNLSTQKRYFHWWILQNIWLKKFFLNNFGCTKFLLPKEDFLSGCSDPGLLFILVCMLLLAVAAVFVQSLSLVWLFATPWIAACQISLSFTVSWSLLKVMPIESVMRSNHLILCRPLLLLPSVFPSIRVFSSESGLHSRWPKHWSFSISISRQTLIHLYQQGSPKS